jgi:hypothetical protein
MENTNRVVRMRGVSDRVAVTGPIEDNEAVKNQNLYESRQPVPSLFGDVRLVAQQVVTIDISEGERDEI